MLKIANIDNHPPLVHCPRLILSKEPLVWSKQSTSIGLTKGRSSYGCNASNSVAFGIRGINSQVKYLSKCELSFAFMSESYGPQLNYLITTINFNITEWVQQSVSCPTLPSKYTDKNPTTKVMPTYYIKLNVWTKCIVIYAEMNYGN